ncbi:hypothetical protein GGI1_08753 [Acidithiobacillus sp. GGI-221]|jgi:hypothetical protein|nr:hypothetical protein GGI1_08753 [Acidithiobacillus sp. GGI-221]
MAALLMTDCRAMIAARAARIMVYIQHAQVAEWGWRDLASVFRFG